MRRWVDLPPAEVARLADLIAGTVTACPAVAGLADAPGGQVATYLPGRVVPGVAVRLGEIEVCVTARLGLPLPEVATQVRQAVMPLVPGWVIDVVIGAIAVPGPGQDRAGGP